MAFPVGDWEREVGCFENIEVTKTYGHDEFLQQVISQRPAAKNKHIAIVGEPGAGKTTLLNAIALYIKDNTQNLPICISLGSLEGMTLEDYLLKKWLPDAMRLVNPQFVSTPEIENQLNTGFYRGDFWLLLDGVDEMGVSSPVQALAKIAQELKNGLGQARVILTCRLNVWDASLNNNILPGFITYKTQEFKAEQVDEFIYEWFTHAENIQQGEELKAKLKQPGKERIRELVTNPLRLVLLCQTFYLNKDGELPETKAGLFERYTRYFYDWKSESVPQELIDSHELRQELHQALGKLALAGINNNSRFRLKESLAVQQMGDRLFKFACGVGWLNLVDRDADNDEAVYAFFHPNFQEYFAALAIDDWHDFLNHNNENPNPLVKYKNQQCVYRVFEAQWNEVILLWFGRQDNDFIKRIDFIEFLIKFCDGCINFYAYRALLLAVICIMELIDTCNKKDLIIGLEKILYLLLIQVFDIAFYSWDKPFFEPIAEEARKIITKIDRTLTIELLIEVIANCEERALEAMEILGIIGNGNQLAIDTLCYIVENHEYAQYERDFSAEILKEIAISNQKIIDELVTIMFISETEDIRNLSAGVLEYIAIGNQSAIDKIWQKLNEIKDKNRFWKHYCTLAIIFPEGEKVIHDGSSVLVMLNTSANKAETINGQY